MDACLRICVLFICLEIPMWVLVLISLSTGGAGRAIDHIEFTSKERCMVAQEFSIKRDTIKDAYCVQK